MVCITFLKGRFTDSFASFLLVFTIIAFLVTRYKILDVQHNPFIGKSSLTRQSHLFYGSVDFVAFYLVFCIFVFAFIFIFILIWHSACENSWVLLFLLKIFANLWFGGKCLLINLINILPMMVFTNLLYGDLNQIMLCFIFLLFWLFSFGCWYCSLVLYPLFLCLFS